MVQLNLFNTYSEEDLHSPKEHDGFLYDTKVMLNILQPWVNKQRRAVSRYCYFASVQACGKLKKCILRFT